MTPSSYTASKRLLVLFLLIVVFPVPFKLRSEMMAHGQLPVVTARELTTTALALSVAERRSSQVAIYPRTMTQIPIPGLKKETSVKKILADLAKFGPLFPAVAFSMSNFKVEGFVKGGWPIVVVYELEADSRAEVTITTLNNRKPETFRIPLQPTNGEQREEKRQIPDSFGEKPQLGSVSFRALKNGPEPRKPAHFFLHGLGVGDKAVGSIVIDQLKFQPRNIHPKLKEKASYSFHSISDFNTGSADFMRVTRSSDNVIHFEPIARETLKDGIGRDQRVTKGWDGKNDKGKVSLGPHQFRVRVWRGLKSGGDWVSAFSPQVVTVE